MTKVERIESEIQELTRSELAVLRNWFRRYDAEAWDRQIEEDAAAGKIDELAEVALRQHRAGKTKEL